MRKSLVVVLVAVCLIAGAVGGAIAGFYGSRYLVSSQESKQSPLYVPVQPDATPGKTQAVALEGENWITSVYKKVSPAVVNIQNVSYTMGFFGPSTETSTGSGFIIDAEGHVLTNYHVVKGASSIKVGLYDGTVAEGELVGSDPGNDLALLQLKGLKQPPLAVATVGDSDQVEVGEFVVALGNPFGLDRTITFGIISGKGRVMTSETGRVVRDVLQTDAAINPGNSGGPLLNAKGEVIGINTAIESPVRGSVGIGFAVPINAAKRVLGRMMAGERVRHPWLGISGIAITKDLVKQYDLPVDKGVLVYDVVPDGPAAKAGLRGMVVRSQRSGWTYIEPGRVGDIIVAIDDQPVASVDDISRIIDGKQVGDTVRLTVIRQGQGTIIQVKLGEWPETS
ncbi:MAG: S1C family serine protease [Bacillota bacterium]